MEKEIPFIELELPEEELEIPEGEKILLNNLLLLEARFLRPAI